MKIYLQKQKEVDQNNCEIESTLVRDNNFPKNGCNIVQSIKEPSESQMLIRFAC